LTGFIWHSIGTVVISYEHGRFRLHFLSGWVALLKNNFVPGISNSLYKFCIGVSEFRQWNFWLNTFQLDCTLLWITIRRLFLLSNMKWWVFLMTCGHPYRWNCKPILCMGVWWFIVCPTCLYRHPAAISEVPFFLFLYLICFICYCLVHGTPLISERTIMKTNE
jgi:hypothetical protein